MAARLGAIEGRLGAPQPCPCALVYIRVSTTEQASTLSLPTQEKACRDYCGRHGYEVDRVFTDAGESAKTADRPAFNELLRYCREQRGRVKVVVVYALTRFARNSTDHHTVAALLRGLGVTLRSVTEPIDDSSSGRLMEGILAAMAQWDNEVRSERVVAGMRAAVARGRWVWSAPLGYLNADARHGASLVPDSARAPAVRRAFEICAAGVTGRALLEQVSALGLRTKRGNPLSISRLYELLRHPVYTGVLRSIAWETDRAGDFEPLVSAELFGRVQLRLNAPARAAAAPLRHVNHPEFPLRRFVRCEQCGRGLTGSAPRGRNGLRYSYYHCKAGCSHVAKAIIEAAFVELLDALRPRCTVVRAMKALVLDLYRAHQAGARQAHTAAGARVATIAHKLEQLEASYVYDERIDGETYRRQRDLLREQRATAQLVSSELEIEPVDVEGLLQFAETALERASLLWVHAESAERRLQVQWSMFPEGLVWRPSRCFSGDTVTCWEYSRCVVNAAGVAQTPAGGTIVMIDIAAFTELIGAEAKGLTERQILELRDRMYAHAESIVCLGLAARREALLEMVEEETGAAVREELRHGRRKRPAPGRRSTLEAEPMHGTSPLPDPFQKVVERHRSTLRSQSKS